MDIKEIMAILEQMGVAVFATVDQEGLPHARHIHIGVANEQGIFFMTGPNTGLYRQLMADPQLAITAMSQEDYLIQVIRIEGKARPIGPQKLQELLEGNPYVGYVYPDPEDQADIQVFHLYEGKGFYHSLTQGHKYLFTLSDQDPQTIRALS